MKITPSSGQTSTSRPQDGDKVTVLYQCRLQDGTIIDSTKTYGRHLKFRMGEGAVIVGLERGVASLRAGETA
jgi:FKBP-type peptidyl-prolyl cis-trans isomerase